MRKRWGTVALLVACIVAVAAPAFPQAADSDGVIVYSRFTPEPGDSVLCITDPEGSRTALIRAFEDDTVTDTVWSPDGDRVAFVRDGAEIVVMDLAAFEETVVTHGRAPSWSPDGERLAFERDGSVVAVDIDGTNEEVLGAGRNPDWSPDGERIAFDQVPEPIITDGPEGELRTMDTNGNDIVDLGYGQEPAWSPDGSRIAYAVHTYWGSDLGWKNADGSGGRYLTRANYGDQRPSRPAWSPDGTRIVYPRKGELWVVGLDETDGHRILEQGGAADWGPGSSDVDALWDNPPCVDPPRPTLFVNLRLRGHLFARGRVWTNDPEQCSIAGLEVGVWKDIGSSGLRLAGRDETDKDGRYRMEVTLKGSGGVRLRDRPGRYMARLDPAPSGCARANSNWKVHRH